MGVNPGSTDAADLPVKHAFTRLISVFNFKLTMLEFLADSNMEAGILRGPRVRSNLDLDFTNKKGYKK